MSREHRSAHVPLFAEQMDFNEQLYRALKSSPWWMLSIGFHVLLFVISSMIQSDAPIGAPPTNFSATMGSAADPLPDEEAKKEAEETEMTHEEDVVAKEPKLTDDELSNHNETDNDMPTEGTLGDAGVSNAPFEGPSKNAYIGIGGGGGGAFPGRLGGHHNYREGAGGGHHESQIDDALKWLKAHQSPDGGWEAEGWNRWCEGKPAAGPLPAGSGKAQYDVGVTGLALLAYLGAGFTNRSDDANGFGKVVAHGLRYLRNAQDAEGCFGSRGSGHYVYNHATAALAMVEAYGMTGATAHLGSAQKALDFIALSRNPYFAWRYGVKPGDNDTSVSGWMMMALKSARLVNKAALKSGKPPPLVIDEDAFDGIKSWVEKMTDPDTGRAGYQTRGTGPARATELTDKFPAEKSESMTGVAMLARIFLGENPKTSKAIQDGAHLCEQLVPSWNPNDGSIDMYYWYYATLAMFQVGGSPWQKWNKAMDGAIAGSQRKDTDYCMYKGSWDNIDPWGGDGGRVYSTALMAMCLEVYYRYDLVAGAKDER